MLHNQIILRYATNASFNLGSHMEAPKNNLYLRISEFAYLLFIVFRSR